MIEEMNSSANAGGFNDSPTREEVLEHGFYYFALSNKERMFYELALAQEGLEHEIALLKAKIEYFALIYPLNMRMMVGAINALKGLMRVHYSIFKKDQAGDLDRKLGEYMDGLGLPPEKLRAAWDKAHATS
jgi:hypothetical protein